MSERPWIDPFIGRAQLVSVVVTVIAAIFAAVAAIAARDGANAAKLSADAAREQVEDARDTTRRELRAYVSVELARVISIGENGINHIPLAIVNSGQTPAFNLTFDSLSFQATPENFAKQKLEPALREFVPLGIGFIPRQTSRTRSFATKFPINPEAMRTGTHRLYSIGRIFYDDAWGDEHWVKFCIWWGSDGFAPKDATYCNRFNDTDRPGMVQQ